MATQQEIQIFKKLLEKWLDAEKAKQIITRGRDENTLQVIWDNLWIKVQTETETPKQSSTQEWQFMTPMTQDPWVLTVDKLKNIVESSKKQDGLVFSAEWRWIISNIGEKLWERTDRIKENILKDNQTITSDKSPIIKWLTSFREWLQVWWEVVGWVYDVSWELVGAAAEKYIPEPLRKLVWKATTKVLESDTWKQWVAALRAWVEAYDQFSKAFPETAATINGVTNIATLWTAPWLLKKLKWKVVWLNEEEIKVFNTLNNKKTKTKEEQAQLDDFKNRIWEDWIKEIEKTKQEAEALVGQFLNPTKNETTRTAKRIWPEILERDIKGTREDVLDMAQEQKAIFGKKIEDYEKNVWVNWVIKRDDLLKIIDDTIDNEVLFLQKIQTQAKKWEIKELDIIPWQESKVKDVEALSEFIGWLPDEIDLATDGIRLRRAFDQVYSWTDATLDQFKNELRLDLWNALRKEISKNNPDLAEINKEFSFYKWLETVLEETQDRRYWKNSIGEWLETRKTQQIISATTAVWWATWYAIAWTEWAVIWGFIWRQTWYAFDKFVSTPRYKLAKAQDKKKLADAIASWDGKKIKIAMDAIILYTQMNPDELKFVDTEAEQQSRENSINRLKNLNIRR